MLRLADVCSCLLVRTYAKAGGRTLLSFSADVRSCLLVRTYTKMSNVRCCPLVQTYGGPPPDVRSDR
jgi:hypothetical protein